MLALPSSVKNDSVPWATPPAARPASVHRRRTGGQWATVRDCLGAEQMALLLASFLVGAVIKLAPCCGLLCGCSGKDRGVVKKKRKRRAPTVRPTHNFDNSIILQSTAAHSSIRRGGFDGRAGRRTARGTVVRKRTWHTVSCRRSADWGRSRPRSASSAKKDKGGRIFLPLNLSPPFISTRNLQLYSDSERYPRVNGSAALV